MRIVDGHIHLRADADAVAVLNQMDENGIDRMIIMSPNERSSLEKTRENLLAAKQFCAVAPDRLTGLAWVEPTISGIAGLVKEALADWEFAGVKMIPDHWYAYEERLEPFWEAMNELEARILFHTGILYDYEDGSRFNRPVYLEKLVNYPNIQFAMAHISWPWCEECLAVMGRFRAANNYKTEGWQSYIDITPGSTGSVAKQAIADAVQMCGVERMMFGTDNSIPGDMPWQRQSLDRIMAILDELGLDSAQKQRIFAGTADELFPAMS